MPCDLLQASPGPCSSVYLWRLEASGRNLWSQTLSSWKRSKETQTPACFFSRSQCLMSQKRLACHFEGVHSTPLGLQLPSLPSKVITKLLWLSPSKSTSNLNFLLGYLAHIPVSLSSASMHICLSTSAVHWINFITNPVCQKVQIIFSRNSSVKVWSGVFRILLRVAFDYFCGDCHVYLSSNA